MCNQKINICCWDAKQEDQNIIFLIIGGYPPLLFLENDIMKKHSINLLRRKLRWRFHQKIAYKFQDKGDKDRDLSRRKP